MSTYHSQLVTLRGFEHWQMRHRMSDTTERMESLGHVDMSAAA